MGLGHHGPRVPRVLAYDGLVDRISAKRLSFLDTEDVRAGTGRRRDPRLVEAQPFPVNPQKGLLTNLPRSVAGNA